MKIKFLLKEGSKQIWYNGSVRPRLTWTTENVGKGHDQQGPGLYFTSSENDARAYGAYVHKVYLNLTKKRTVPLKGVLAYDVIKKLVTSSPSYEIHISNWDENERVALQKAIAAMQNSNGIFDTLQQIWIDFYKNDPIEFLSNVSEFYDGAVITRSVGLKHAIIFNPSVIEVIK